MMSAFQIQIVAISYTIYLLFSRKKAVFYLFTIQAYINMCIFKNKITKNICIFEKNNYNTVCISFFVKIAFDGFAAIFTAKHINDKNKIQKKGGCLS